MKKTQCRAGLDQGRAVLVDLLRDLRGSMVPCVRIQGRDQHQAGLHELIYPILVGDDAPDAVIREGSRGVGQSILGAFIFT